VNQMVCSLRYKSFCFFHCFTVLLHNLGEPSKTGLGSKIPLSLDLMTPRSRRTPTSFETVLVARLFAKCWRILEGEKESRASCLRKSLTCEISLFFENSVFSCEFLFEKFVLNNYSFFHCCWLKMLSFCTVRKYSVFWRWSNQTWMAVLPALCIVFSCCHVVKSCCL